MASCQLQRLLLVTVCENESEIQQYKYTEQQSHNKIQRYALLIFDGHFKLYIVKNIAAFY